MKKARKIILAAAVPVVALVLLDLSGFFELHLLILPQNPDFISLGRGCGLWEYKGFYRWLPQTVRVVRVDLAEPAIEVEVNGPGPTDEERMLTALAYHRMKNEALAPLARCSVTVNGNVSGDISAGIVRSFADPAHLLIHDWPQYCFGVEEHSGKRKAFVREMYLRKEEVGRKAPSGVRCALLSWPYYAWPLIEKGKNAYREESLDFEIIDERHPRTIVGTDAEGRFVYLAVMKGRDPFHAFGMSFAEAADFLLEHFPEISDAINLDGGFSSILVLDRPGGLREVFPDNHEDRKLPDVVQVIETVAPARTGMSVLP